MSISNKTNCDKFMSTCIRRWRQHKWEECDVQVHGQCNRYNIVSRKQYNNPYLRSSSTCLALEHPV